MKRRFSFVVLLLMMWSYAEAAHWMTYYVYHEAYYEQGPWSRTDLLRKSGFRYLAVEKHEDLFGTESAQLVQKMLSRLKGHKPELYDWEYNLEIKNDTAIIVPAENMEPAETIKNEIIATLGVNGFKIVRFGMSDAEEIWTLKDLTLPFFDLVSRPQTGESRPKVSEEKEDDFPDSADRQQEEVEEDIPRAESDRSSFPVLLIVSALLNVILLVLLLKKNSSGEKINS